MTEEIETEKAVFIRGRVPESVRARFKAACALRGQDMGDALGEMIMKWLEEHEPSPLPVRKKTTAAEPTVATTAKGGRGKGKT
ncbi:plasmid partition protein ParG [Microcoleus sp. T3_A4]|uniref:plasmid partition protein ParG n=1 Tax=Microcoleus sp. T3_A4 TaxID=2818968 RepID=UPI002FD503B9